MTSARRIISICVIAMFFPICSANAAVVGFLGTFTSGTAGPVLGSLPQEFTLTLNYTPDTDGLTPAAGTFGFGSGLGFTNYATSGGITVEDNTGPGGTDVFRFTGNIAPGVFGPTQVNYSFEFLQPDTTVDNLDINPTSLSKLITGQTSIFFVGSGASVAGSVRGAPEPSTMLALTGLVVGGCGIGYRRRRMAGQDRDESEQQDS